MRTPSPVAAAIILIGMGCAGDLSGLISPQHPYARLISGAFLVFRIAAIGGILTQTRTGWWVAFSFCLVGLGTNLVAVLSKTQSMHPLFLLAAVFLPGLCMGFLWFYRDELKT